MNCMNTHPDIEQRLWDYIDGSSSVAEKQVIEQLLEADAEWKAKYKELLEVNALLQSTELEVPSLRFTKNVMEEIGKLHVAPAAKSYINKKIIWGIGFFFIAMLLGILIYGFGQMLAADSGGQTTISKNLDKIDFSKFFNNSWVNALMMINVVIGLLLFDNYLSAKRKNFKKA